MSHLEMISLRKTGTKLCDLGGGFIFFFTPALKRPCVKAKISKKGQNSKKHIHTGFTGQRLYAEAKKR